MHRLRLALAGVALAGLVAATVLLLVPLPTLRTATLGQPATVVCGSGTSSASAISVLLDPGQLGQSTPTPTIGQEQQLEVAEQLCLGMAQTRLLEAMGIALPLAVACLVLGAIVGAPRRRASSAFEGPQPAGWYPDPWSPGSWRWWDGARWGPPHPGPPGHPVT